MPLILAQIAHKWDKSGIFSDQILVHFGSASQNVLKSDLKKSRIFVPFVTNLSDLCGKSPAVVSVQCSESYLSNEKSPVTRHFNLHQVRAVQLVSADIAAVAVGYILFKLKFNRA